MSVFSNCSGCPPNIVLPPDASPPLGNPLSTILSTAIVLSLALYATIVAPSQKSTPFGITIPIALSASITLIFALYQWSLHWFLSGFLELVGLVILGALKGHKILPFVPLWLLWLILPTMQVVYALCATSHLFPWIFAAGCWPFVFMTCVLQFNFVARVFRRSLRRFLKQVSFLDDIVALFDIPALEIDTEVDGLMVIRGAAFSWSTLTLTCFGIEVGIKLSDDMELAITTEKITIALFRRIDIDDCYAAIKGGQYEMTFQNMAEDSHDADGNALMVEDTPLLQAAAAHGVEHRPRLVKMTSRLTGGDSMKDSTAQSGLESIKKISSDDRLARQEFEQTIKWIEDTNIINECRKAVRQRTRRSSNFDPENAQDLRAAICSQLHNKPSVPHPPEHSIRVSTLRDITPQWQKTLMHRMPALLRMLLLPLSYFHTISIKAVTLCGSGLWLSHMLRSKFFKDYSENNAELRRLEQRLLGWLADANFAIELADITGLAYVPFFSNFDIETKLVFGDVMAYRTLPNESNLTQVVRLGGADAAFTIPSYLLPHHEHIIPPVPSQEDEHDLEIEIQDADGKPNTVHKERKLSQVSRDEANVRICTHVKLPVCLDQELIDFVSALIKATKVIEFEKAPDAMEERESGFRGFVRGANQKMKDEVKKTMVDGIVNDRVISRLVGKVVKKLGNIVGEGGYSGNIPVALEQYRLPEGHVELQKILP